MIRITVDSERSISLAETSKIAKNIRESKEINLLYPNGVRIEVTTPGISSPLEFTFQYKKNIGRVLNISLLDVKKKNFQGILTDVNKKKITIDSNEHKLKQFNLDQIRKATVKVSF